LIALIDHAAVLLRMGVYYPAIISGVIVWLAVSWDQLRRRRLSRA
jgi:ribose transport system permease protein